jgi:3-methyladenine DNA glycosylase AlkD
MVARELLRELESAGTAQNRKIYARHGVKRPTFGVSFANLHALAKRINLDHGLGRELWASGNYAARILATMIADPRQADDAVIGAGRASWTATR